MLAVQRPRMGSSKPPNLEMPFGYAFDDNPNFPFPSPTAPAPGPSLLDDNESKFLDSFFDGVSGDNTNYDFFSNAPERSEPGLVWEELPPAFMGTSSSYGQQPRIASNGAADSNFNNVPPHMSSARPSLPPSTSADVLAAASLLQNGSTGRTHSISNESLFQGQNMLHSANGQMRSQSMSQFPPARPNAMQERVPDDGFSRNSLYTDMMFGNTNAPPRPRLVRPGHSKADIRWGSDQGFGSPQGFVPPPNQEKASVVERSHIEAVEGALQINQLNSSDSTRPSSPIMTHSIIPYSRSQPIGQVKNEDDQDSRPRKRRKSKFQEEEDDNESVASVSNKAGSKKRKAPKKASSNDSPTSSEQHSKRRKSAAAASAAAKTARENLTEDQKRENHIKSEQKRRTLIREGFEDLGELVPGLRGGGFSKSAVLIMAADWLEDLINGNEVLRMQLDAIQGRG